MSLSSLGQLEEVDCDYFWPLYMGESVLIQSIELSVKHGTVKNHEVNLYAIVRNEMFFLPAFFDHYRGLGVEQFIILDDKSDDGTSEFLLSQTDCVVLTTGAAFGEQVTV